MSRIRPQEDLLFALFEVQRLVRQYAEREVRKFGITRAQWAVVAKLERYEGLKQAELAELMEMQPITLTRLIDRLCEADLIERRSDPDDRRVNRLYLRPAARPLLDLLHDVRAEVMRTALGRMPRADVRRLVGDLETIRNNVRAALQCDVQGEEKTSQKDSKKERRYG